MTIIELEAQPKASLIVGYICDKRFDVIVKHMTMDGHQMVSLDLTRSLDEQGSFDVIVHKLTKVIGEVNTSVASSNKIRAIDEYVKRHPRCLLLDSPSSVATTTDRVKLDQKLQSLCIFDDFGNTIRYPKTVIVSSSGTLDPKFRFPAVAKPQNADGSTESHDMAMVFSERGLKELQSNEASILGRGNTVVLQEFINHDAVLHKIYVMGDHVFMGTRPSLPNVIASENNPPFEFFGRISYGEDERQAPIVPPMELIEQLCSELRNRLGLNLFGVDVITKSASKEHYVIDVNYFPSYAGMPQIPLTFEKFLLKSYTNLSAVQLAKGG